MKNVALIFAAIFGLLGVGLGAFGAHGLERLLLANGRLDTWHTAVLYQFVHAGLLLGLSLLRDRSPDARLLRWATWATIVGILIFSGSLYLLSLTNITWLGAVTPFGGLSFLVAWSLILFYAFQRKE
jgi:uncharacterized membrane protein YgdD (TMEM256/DUF423 family)